MDGMWPTFREPTNVNVKFGLFAWRCRDRSLRDTGVAGMRDFTAVKCLHCHYAHYLARPQHGNVIGEWVHELLQLKAMEAAT
jgi:hypothetical protein